MVPCHDKPNVLGISALGVHRLCLRGRTGQVQSEQEMWREVREWNWSSIQVLETVAKGFKKIWDFEASSWLRSQRVLESRVYKLLAKPIQGKRWAWQGVAVLHDNPATPWHCASPRQRCGQVDCKQETFRDKCSSRASFSAVCEHESDDFCLIPVLDRRSVPISAALIFDFAELRVGTIPLLQFEMKSGVSHDWRRL